MQILKQNHVTYGLIMCAVTIACLLLMEITGQDDSFVTNSPFQLIYMYLAPAVVWYFGIKTKRMMLGGQLTFKEGFTEGFKIGLVYAIVSPFIFLAYYKLLNPEILDYIRTAYRMTEASDSKVIVIDMVTQFFAATIFGAIYAAIISLVLKSRPPQVTSGTV